MKKEELLLAAGIIGTGLAALALRGSKTKTDAPEALLYNIIGRDKDFELRDYKPYRVAKVATRGNRKKAVDQAFNVLFKYISGKNKKHQKLAMTSPVTQMAKDGPWEVNFVMPNDVYDLPKPKDKRITLKEEKGGRFIAHRFSGRWSDANIQKHKNMLDKFVADNNILSDINAIYAYYNSPRTLPWKRRNEVMYKVS